MISDLIESTVRESHLPNGIRVATETVPHAYGVAIGIRVHSGSRDEDEQQVGISHLLEHMFFKGTTLRSARQIAEEMDAIGGNLDAFTSKEYAGYGSRVLPEHVPFALELLTDVLRNPRLDEDDLELEKSVVLEEIKGIEDSPEEYVHEVFSASVWPDHPLGRPIIGTPEIVSRLSAEELREHLTRHYVPERLVFAASGAISHEEFEALVSQHFGDLAGEALPRSTESPVCHTPRTLLARATEQTHFCMGLNALSETDPDRWALRIVNLILGGGMSSRLFQEIREERGLCYSIGSDLISFREGGLFVIYSDTSPEHVEELEELARAALQRVTREGVSLEELGRAKAQVRAATLLSLDDVGTRMNRLARSILYHNRVVPLADLMSQVDRVTAEDCLRVAERVFSGSELAFAAIGPF